MTRAFGDTQWDSATGQSWDGSDGVCWGDTLPVSVAEAVTLGFGEQDPAVFATALTVPNRKLKVDTDGTETVTIYIQTAIGTSSFQITGEATAANVSDAAEAEGISIIADGGPLGTAPIVIEFTDLSVDDYGSVWGDSRTVEVVDELCKRTKIPYTIKVNERTIPFWVSAELTMTMDEPSELRLKLANPDDALSSSLSAIGSCNIAVLDRYGLPIDSLVVMNLTSSHVGDAVFLDVVANGRLAQTSQVSVNKAIWAHSDLDGTASATRVSNSIDTGVKLSTLVASLAESSSAITVGEIDAQIANTMTCGGIYKGSMLEVLRAEQLKLPPEKRGILSVDSSGVLSWRIPKTTGRKTLEFGQRLQSLTVEMDSSNIITKIAPSGGYADWVIANCPSRLERNISLYGIREATLDITNDTTTDLALAHIDSILDSWSLPALTYKCDIIDLAKADTQSPADRAWTPDGHDGAWEDLRVGETYSINDSRLGVSNVPCQMRQIQINLANPLKTTVEFNKKTPNLGSVIKEITGGGGGGGGGGGDPFINDDTPTEIPVVPPDVPTDPAQTVFPSDDIPQPVAETGAAGVSELYSRGDHVHEGPVMPGPGDIPADVSTEEASTGTSEACARADHTHKFPVTDLTGFVKYGGEVSSLPAIPTVGVTMVYWTGGDPAQLWVANKGQDVWTPVQFATNDAGDPPA